LSRRSSELARKGIAAASLGPDCSPSEDSRFTIQKFDPYINFDPGTMYAVFSTAKCT